MNTQRGLSIESIATDPARIREPDVKPMVDYAMVGSRPG
jgi:hypothetical protein